MTINRASTLSRPSSEVFEPRLLLDLRGQVVNGSAIRLYESLGIGRDIQEHGSCTRILLQQAFHVTKVRRHREQGINPATRP